MLIKIKKGNHYPFPRFAIGSLKWVNSGIVTKMERKFLFTESCLFDLVDEDQHDVNKLFGFSIGLHHNTSFRYGWRPDLETRTIEIVAYEYHDKVRQATIPICKVDLNKWVFFGLYYSPEGHSKYVVINNGMKTITNTVNVKKKSGLGYTLGFYFGGNETAPQDIVVYRTKV